MLDTTKLEHRKRLISTFVNAIYLYDDKLVIVFNYKDSTASIPLEDVNDAVDALVPCSDLVLWQFFVPLLTACLLNAKGDPWRFPFPHTPPS